MKEAESSKRAPSEEDGTPNQRDNKSGTPNDINRMVPDWVEGLDSEPKEALDNGSEERDTLEQDEMVLDRASLEGLSHDVTSIILSHLSVRDIGKAALSSRALAIAVRADGLWELKFRARWNFVPVGRKQWRQCFRAAHDNPHDLWISHWNVVEPHDTTTAPGRCCIVPQKVAQRTKRHRKQSVRRETNMSPPNLSPVCHKCPECRCCDETSHENVGNNWNEMLNRAMQTEHEYQQKCLANKDADEAIDPVLQAEQVAAAYAIAPSQCIGDMVNVTSMFTPAKAVLASTQYSIAKWCRNHFLQNGSIDKTTWTATQILACPRHGESVHAFRAAATFHRPLPVEQYQSSGLHFMTDLLFFNVQPTYEKTPTLSKGTQITEVEQMARDIYGTDRMAEYHQSQSASTSNRDDANWWKEPCRSNSTVAGLGLDTAHHTWHVVQLTNPDFRKPLSFRVYVQRPECFTVYPSEGFLLPGETQHLTFGVTSFGSLISEAFENLNANREEVNQFLADVYTHEAHLPYAPFAIRYMFAPVIPCIPPMFGARGKPIIPPPPRRRGNQSGGRYKPILDHLWDSVATESDVRTLYLSAHVNSNYAFNEFQLVTLSPFEVLHIVQSSLQQPPLTMVAPNLEHLYPSLFNDLHNMRLEIEVSTSGHSYRTEKSCTLCGKDWGIRSEELGRAFVLRKLTCVSHLQKETRQMKNVVEVIRILSILILNHTSVSAAILKAHGGNSSIGQSLERKILNDDVLVLKRVHQLLYYVHAVLLQKRSNRLVTKHQRHILRQYELHVEELCIRVQARLIYFGIHTIDQEAMDKLSNHNLHDGLDEFCDYILMTTPWKAVGVHKTTLGTDSIFEPDQSLSDISLHSLLVDEPEYLDGFRNLLHNPGTYSLGRQEDPNYDHVVSPCLSNDAAVSKDARQNPHNRYTDLYMNDTTMAFVSALSLVHDPRSLMVHGVYDRVRYPGKVTRRPFLEGGIFVRPLLTVRSWREIASPVGGMVNDFMRQQRTLSSELNNEKHTAVLNVHTVQLKQCTIKPHICFQLDDIDVEGHQLVHFGEEEEEAQLQEIRHASSIKYYLNGIPYPGIGRFPLSDVRGAQENESIVSLNIYLRQESGSSGHGPISCSVLNDHSQRIQNRNLQQEGRVDENLNANMPMPGMGVGPGARFANLVWFLSAYLGWSVDNQRITGSMILDRRILIAGQWLSNTFMAMPLVLTLLARYGSWITANPLDYHLEGFPFSVDKEMRYFTSHECGYAALVVMGLWLIMGRYCERHSGRSYERIMTENIPMNGGARQKKWLVEKVFLALILFAQRIWDCTCPLFLQRRVFTPSWNQRSVRELYDHIIHSRSNDLREHRTMFHADNGIGKVRNGKGIKETSSSWKLLIGTVIGIGSFCASSPHFFLNLLTVFYCSIAFGMSMSLQSLEAGRGPANAPTMISRLRPLGLNTLIIAFFLLGQLLGSSGGVQFLAEFVVTSVSLMLGGAASVSTTAVESWLCFFTLSTTSFWGYVFARVGLLNGIRRKRRGSSSTVLSSTIFICACLWIYAIFFWEWELPPSALVIRVGSNALFSNKKSDSAQKHIEQLQ
eukprot:CAMPEP_0198281926 /NCGR_PEP_ID=MMETSP1449-20131203/1804_1 /TAXON_ID=420275 /ORGANISM="Attheya septentrionalis, Strain CCMP2084" /LENGTH=1574 /DNA_ID=CAMNT_0043977945 /DNA_START=222 /DNA_END=4946 /DNA_ORIENTATION=+